MNSPQTGDGTAIERARYKLRQAELALSYLRRVPANIAADLRRAHPIAEHDLRLDTFFFSCLGLAKSAFYIIERDQKWRHKAAIHNWRVNVLGDRGCRQFNRMVKLRDNDVHHGRTEGKALPTFIPIERGIDDDWEMYQPRPNYAVFGIPPPVTERTNPDGSTVSSHLGLQGSLALYVDVAGETFEAANACDLFITQLHKLIDTVSAANVPARGPP